MRIFCGIDLGSSTIKIVLLDEEERIVAHSICTTGGRIYTKAVQALDALLEAHGIDRSRMVHTVSTGYGRKLFREADESVSEITANAFGAMHCSAAVGGVKTILNIGGQDSKAILLDGSGRVSRFAMNDKCAAGTGRFLEMAARLLDAQVEELSALHQELRGAPVTINSTCTVFAESEIVSLIAKGRGREEIVAGVHHAIARRIVRLAGRIGIEDPVLFDGGPALNRGLVSALEHELMRQVIVSEAPQITTALGAALIARKALTSGPSDR